MARTGGGPLTDFDVTAVVDLVHTEGRRTFPTVSLSRATIGAEIERRVAAGSLTGQPNHPADLYLATACALGDATALEIIETASFRRIPDFIARIDTSNDFAAEVAQVVRQKLFVGLPERRAVAARSASTRGWARWEAGFEPWLFALPSICAGHKHSGVVKVTTT